MRQPRRHRWLTVSIFFIACFVGQAVLSPSTSDEMKSKEESTLPSLLTKAALKKYIDITEKMTPKELEESTPPGEKEQLREEEEDTRRKRMMEGTKEPDDDEEQKDAGYIPGAEPTFRPPRYYCYPPAIEQFPRPLMGQSTRKHGGLVIHILVAVFTFIGLAIVCEEYFVSSLHRICEELKLAPDVTGATFMAAGCSAPVLATVIIGVFCAQDDIGVSIVIGPTVFNNIFVISVCALCAGTVSHLNWWPLCRDCFFYAISILVMMCTIANGYVSWSEALCMLITYGVYCVVLRFNTTLERWAKTLTRKERTALVTYASAGGAAPAQPGGDQCTQMEGQTKETALLDHPPFNPDGAYDNADSAAQAWDPNTAWGEQPQPAQPSAPASSLEQMAAQHSREIVPGTTALSEEGPTPVAVAPVYYKAKEYHPKTAVNPRVRPIGANHLQLAYWYVAYPVHWSCRHTIPDCRGRWYPLTFIISMLWISFYSYFMVWMIAIIGHTLTIPDAVMGTFVPAGASVPGVLSSLAVVKKGYGNMAVSNAVGSNVFDILVCLGLPWFIQTAIIQPGSHVNVISKGFTYSFFSLFSTLIFLVVATLANCCKLDRKYGVVLMIWYFLFITFASLYELNVFGYFFPPDCQSMY